MEFMKVEKSNCNYIMWFLPFRETSHVQVKKVSVKMLRRLDTLCTYIAALDGIDTNLLNACSSIYVQNDYASCEWRA